MIPSVPGPDGGGREAIVPPGNYPAVCVRLLDLGHSKQSYQGQPPRSVHRMELVFELPTVPRGRDGEPITVNQRLNLTPSPLGHLAKSMTSWLGPNWAQSLPDGTFRGLLGRAGELKIEHGTARSGNLYARIAEIKPLPPLTPKPVATLELRMLELGDGVMPVWLTLWQAEDIRASDEYLEGGLLDFAPRRFGGMGEHLEMAREYVREQMMKAPMDRRRDVYYEARRACGLEAPDGQGEVVLDPDTEAAGIDEDAGDGAPDEDHPSSPPETRGLTPAPGRAPGS